MSSDAGGHERLEKQLGLMDVYAICTGAMFASGFFLLPGIAAANAGPSVVLAYLASSLLMVPAMYSIAELSSAMPRAAGTYFFIHRSMGPLAGTIGGLGAWLVLIAKSAFALVGMGAYLSLYADMPVRSLAIALTVGFGLLNIFGAKETARLQVWLVVVLVSIMAFFIANGLLDMTVGGETTFERFQPAFPFGVEGFVSTIGLVFISYAGLTKVSSAAEEIKDLDRNLPLGMILALFTVGAIYTAGVAVLVGLVPAEQLREGLTPVASAGAVVFDWLPGTTGVALIVIAAILAFASTGNAGILTASRYPLAMARDRLLWSRFDQLGRFGTPTIGIVVTCGLMVAAILFLDVERLASLGSAFLLLLFALINLSVILMRESRMSSYAPGYRSPLYPWMQILGVISTLGLLFTLGRFYLVFILVILVGSYLWFRWYVQPRVPSRGAIYGLFRRLGENHDEGIDEELWSILQERGASEGDSFDELIARAEVVDLTGRTDYARVCDEALTALAGQLGMDRDAVATALDLPSARGIVPEGAPAVVYDLVHPGAPQAEAVLVRTRRGVRIDGAARFPGAGAVDDDPDESGVVHALVFLVTSGEPVTQRLRLLAQLVSMVEQPGFRRAWRHAHTEQELQETLLRDERFTTFTVGDAGPPSRMVDRRLREIAFPGDTLVAMIRRGDLTIVPNGETMLREGDRVTVIGSPGDVRRLAEDG